MENEQETDKLDKINITENESPGAVNTFPNSNIPTKSKGDKKHHNKEVAILVIAIFFILGVGALSYWYRSVYSKIGHSEIQNPSNGEIKNPSVVVSKLESELKKVDETTTGEVWLDKWVKLEKQSFLLYGYTDDSSDQIVYYEVGKRNNNTIIIAEVPSISNVDTLLFEKTPEGKVEFISRPSSSFVYNNDTESYMSKALSADVSFNKDIHYDSLSYPDQIGVDNKGSVVYMSNTTDLGVPYSDPRTGEKDTTIKKIGNSSIVKRESTNVETKLVSIGYYIRTPLNMMIFLRYEPLDLDLSKYSWQSGDVSVDLLKAISKGCSFGSVSATRIDSITDSDVRQIGKSGNGLAVYEIKDLNNSLVQKAFTEFKDYVQYDTSNTYKDVSVEDFISKYHALILYKDISGQWLVYVRNDFSPAYGCAKPVIYLYPTVEQTVNIKIGADVKVSDPQYNPSTGWSVIAKPSGQLTVNGLQYNSLFWEGPGVGRYPEITEGTIVKRSNAVNTIKIQLAQQGLKNNEIKDFVDYWQDKIPNKPYIRLTWFNTSQMNQLAPLKISPKPTTLIRVFLDMNGLDKPIKIPSQNLKSTPRVGFTVVEWGGLSPYKLY